MAFSNEEKQIIEFGKTNNKTRDEIMGALVKHRGGATTDTPSVEQPKQNSTIKDIGVGIAKGVGSTLMGVGTLGRGIQAAIDPVNTLADYDKQAETLPATMSPFSGKNRDNINERLNSDNNTQKVGKAVGFVAELLFPVGAISKGAGVAAKGSKVVGASFDNLSTRFSALADDVGDGGVRMKDKLIDLVGGLDDRTKTALKRTSREEFDIVVEQGKKALMDDRNRTPLEAVGDNIIAGLKQLQSQANSIGAAKSEVMNKAKVGFKTVGNIGQRAALNIQKQFSGIKLDSGEQRFVESFKQELVKLGNNPRLKDVDAVIDMLQDRIYKSGMGNAVEVTDRVTGILRKSLGELNGQVKNLGGGAYSKANKDYAEVTEVVTEINSRLGKEGASAGSFVKRLFSPSDARTKELFEKLGELTGKDYFKEARLAKFVMEALDDSRAKSLLEEMPSTAGMIMRGFNAAKNNLQLPLKAAENVIKNR